MIKEIDMRKKLIKLMVTLVLGVVICLPGIAAADWAQQFNETGVGNFDAMEFFMVAGGSEWINGAYAFSNGSWLGEVVNPDYAKATGNAITNLTFNLNGTNVGPPNVFTFDFLAWDGGILTGTLKEHVSATYNGGWSFGAPIIADVNNYDRIDASIGSNAVVPLPPSVLLLGSGLLGLGFLPRRKKS
jgi:hypothetical protein